MYAHRFTMSIIFEQKTMKPGFENEQLRFGLRMHPNQTT